MSRNIKTVLKVAFGLTTINMALWNITIYIADNVQDNLYFWNDLVFLFPSVAMIGLFMLVSLLGSDNGDSIVAIITGARVAKVVLITSLIAQFVAIFSNGIFTSIRYLPGGEYEFTRGPMYLVYILGVLAFLGLITTRVIRNFRRSKKHSQQRRALKVVAFTIMAVLVYSLTMNVVIPVATGSQQLIGLGTFSLDIFSVGLALSIARYRLFDVRFFVVRAAAYLFTLSIMTLLFIVPFILCLDFILGRSLDVGHFLLVVALSVGFVYGLQSLRRFFDRLTARIFFRHDYDPQLFLDTLNRSLVGNIDLEKLLQTSSQIIADNLRAEYCVFGIKETELKGIRIIGTAKKEFSSEDIAEARRITPYLGESVIVTDILPPESHRLRQLLSRNDIGVLARLVPELDSSKQGTEGLGYIVLGQKRSGNLYTPQDIQILGIIANELVIAIQNALRFEEIKRFNITLQEEVDAATHKLRRQNKRLEELDNIKDDFISMASHQLRTPLTSVKGYISMVLEGDAGKLNGTQTQMLKQAFASSQRMVFLITDLLNVSRLKTGKFVIDAVPTKLDELIGQELEQLHETAQAKNIELTYAKPKSLPALMLDEVKTRQIIMNFVDNAIYYTPAGGHIKVELSDKPSMVEIRVTDDGIGVPKSEQHHLFTKFYRATNARKARPDGTGLGLFMAQKVILAQGGSVIFSSQENKGSTFGFAFSKSRLAVPDNATRNPSVKVKEPAATK